MTPTNGIRAKSLKFETHLAQVDGEIVALPVNGVNGVVDPMLPCVSWHVLNTNNVFVC